MRILFAGTPDFAATALQALLQAAPSRGWTLIGVYTQPDRPAGRGRKLSPSPVKQAAQAAGIPVHQPRTFKQPEAVADLRALAADILVVAAYGLILPQAVLDAPRLGCLNIHASLLPRWRGAAPIQRAILAGDSGSGISIMQMEAGLDTGPVWLERPLAITPTTTGGELHDALATLGAAAIVEALEIIPGSHRQPRPQDERLATYAKKLSKEEATLDWHQPAARLERQVRAFNPWPVAQTHYRDTTLRVWQAEVVTDAPAAAGPPGRILAARREGIDVATGDGVLRLTRIQPPGKRAMPVGDFLNAHELSDGYFQTSAPGVGAAS